MKSIVNYFIKYPIAANLLMFAILIMGVVGLLGMKSNFFPEVESRIISIQIIYPGASPEEVEEGVINKIEENLKGITGLERVTSVSKENTGTVTVEVLKGYDTDLVLQDVNNAVDQISSFPGNMEPPVIYKRESLGRVITFALSGDVDLKTLKRYARQVEDELRAKDGISKVSLTGFPDEEIEIAFRETDLRNYNLTFDQASQAVASANLEITGGTIKGSKEELLVRARNKSYFAEGLRDIIVKRQPNGAVVRLHEIADIQDQWADSPERNYVNGKPAVKVTVENTLEEDLLSINAQVKEYLLDFNANHREVKATVIDDQSVVLRQRIGLLTENGIIGFIIVSVLLAMFLHWRLALWVAIAIPVSFAGMFILVGSLGVSINVISLFGMILVIGILVDDGIVIGESIYQEHERGESRLNAALNGTMNVLPAVFSAIVTTIIAFSAFFFIDGSLGDFFQEMAIVVIISLTFSLVEGAFILPTHVAHSKALDPDAKPTKFQELFEGIMAWLRDKMYGPVLRFCMHNKFLTVTALLSLLIMTFGAISGGIIRGTFFPVIERDNISVELQMPAGTRETITEGWLNHIQEAAWKANEILSEKYYNGEKQAILRVEKEVGPSTYQGNIGIQLIDGENRGELRVREIINEVRNQAGPIYEAEVISYGSRSFFGKPVSISLVGENYKELKDATESVKERMSNLEELTDVVDNNQEGLREVNITLKDKARYLGLNLQDIIGQVRRGFFGREVQRLQRGRDEVKVWVRYDISDRSDITKLEDMRIRFADGREFPLSEIANLEIKRGVISINHIDGKQEIKVEADVANDDVSVSDITSSLKSEIIPGILRDYPTVTALYEGQNRQQEKSVQSIQIVGSVILALMFFVIALTFRSISQTVAVFLLIPFGMIGVAWGHWLMGLPMSLFSALGIIALIGILVNDTLVFVTTFNSLIESGKGQMEAIYQTGISRFRPIVLTTVTTFAGLAPLLFEKSLQAQFLIPMAISVSFGLLVITVIILLLLPVLMIIMNRFKVYASYLWNGVMPSFEDVEPASTADGGYQYLWYVFLVFVGFGALFSYFGDDIALLLAYIF